LLEYAAVRASATARLLMSTLAPKFPVAVPHSAFPQRHPFPPGVTGTSNAALSGIENTNRGCTLTTNYLPGQPVQPSLALGGGRSGRRRSITGCGGIRRVQRRDLEWFGPTPAAPGIMFINGIALPFGEQTSAPAGVNPGTFTGTFFTGPTATQASLRKEI